MLKPSQIIADLSNAAKPVTSLLDPLDYLMDLPLSSLTALTSSTEGEGGHLFVVEVVGQTGVLGGGVISGELC